MSDNNNPQTPNNMDHVPTAKDYLTNAQGRITDIYNATLKAMRDIEEAKQSLAPDTPAPSAALDEGMLKRLIARTWKEAISFANMHVEDEVCKEITVQAHIDERVYDSLDISIRGEVETEVNLGDHLDIEIPERYDGVGQTFDEILQGFLEQEEKDKEQRAASVTAEPVKTSINLSKSNA